VIARQANTDVTANIKTAPIGDGAIRRRRRIDRWSWRRRRQISCLNGKRRERNNRYECCDEPTHGTALLNLPQKHDQKYETPKRVNNP
jgi:hypothetical protein